MPPEPGSDVVADVDLPSALMEALGPKATPEDAETWTRLTAAQRERALARVAALVDWKDGKGSISAIAAARRSGLTPSRFYRIAAEWRTGPSLAALGTFAGVMKRRSKFDATVINALQAEVPTIVSQNGGASTSRLVQLLVEKVGIDRERLPGATKLREIVEDEVRRVAATHDAGTAVVLDCVATSLPRADGRPHVLFACVDRGTRGILGAALGTPAAAVAAYADVARDALRRISAEVVAWPWGHRLARAEIVLGVDGVDCTALLGELRGSLPTINFQLATSPKRFGRYFRELVGPRLDRVTFTPSRTIEGDAMPANGDLTPWTEGEALSAIQNAVASYNAGLGFAGLGGVEMPPIGLMDTLRLLAR